MTVLTEYCPAKINLFLEVTGKREDGYHDIETVMQKVSLYDRITLTLSEAPCVEICVSSDSRDIPCDESNICARAARMYLERADINSVRVLLHIEKRIPVSAGLGGGSSDAAGVLRALNRAYSALGESEMIELAAKIGADVPFFVIKENAALCRGIGEIMTPMTSPKKRMLLIAMDGEGMSAGEAYRLLDKVVYEKRENVDHSTLFSSDDISGYLYNAFELAVLPVRKRARELALLMKENGARASMMSGSGTSVYGVFDDSESRTVCADKLAELGILSHTAEALI